MGSVMSFFPKKLSKEEREATLNKIKGIVSSTPVIVFRIIERECEYYMKMHLGSQESKTYCGYCMRVKGLLTQLGASYRVVELDMESDGSVIQSALAEMTGLSTVPNVFIGGKHIGGCDTVMEKHKAGQLVPLLTDAVAIA